MRVIVPGEPEFIEDPELTEVRSEEDDGMLLDTMFDNDVFENPDILNDAIMDELSMMGVETPAKAENGDDYVYQILVLHHGTFVPHDTLRV
jgi:hypothetical protein